MTSPYRAMCAELLAWAEHTSSHYYKQPDVLNRARALLAQPVAVGLTDEEWDALVERVWDKYETVGYLGERFMYDSDFGNALDLVRREFTRWGRPTPQPVAVSERLPGPKDVNEDGEGWIIEEGYSYALGDTGDYEWEPHRIVLRPIGEFDAKNGRAWLPANALFTPEATND